MANNKRKLKVLFLYDFLLVNGGAETVSMQFLEVAPDSKLIVGFINEKLFSTVNNKSRVIALTKYTPYRGVQTIKSMLAFWRGRHALKTADVIVFSGNNTFSALLFNALNSKKKILYCHTPPRFVYDLRDYYIRQTPVLLKPVLAVLRFMVRNIYEYGLKKMDVVIVNSENIQRRLKNYLNTPSKVIYPPTDINNFKYKPSQGFYLSTARLENYKRVNLIAEAFSLMPNKKLVIASGGSQLQYLKEKYLKYKNIEFTGWVENAQLQYYLSTCIATIYVPMDEDFGMSPIESMASGKPVIGVSEGGVQETVIDGVTGSLIDGNLTVDKVIDSVEALTVKKAISMKDDCIQQANKFSKALFLSEMKKVIFD